MADQQPTDGQQPVQQSEELNQTRKTINAIASSRRLVIDEVRGQFLVQTRKHVEVMHVLCRRSHEIDPASPEDWDGFKYMLSGVAAEYAAELKLFDCAHAEMGDRINP